MSVYLGNKVSANFFFTYHALSMANTNVDLVLSKQLIITVWNEVFWNLIFQHIKFTYSFPVVKKNLDLSKNARLQIVINASHARQTSTRCLAFCGQYLLDRYRYGNPLSFDLGIFSAEEVKARPTLRHFDTSTLRRKAQCRLQLSARN